MSVPNSGTPCGGRSADLTHVDPFVVLSALAGVTESIVLGTATPIPHRHPIHTVDTRAPRRWPWARLLQRVFGFEVLVCDRCGGRRRILGAVTESLAVRRLLAALGLAPEPPPGRPAPAA